MDANTISVSDSSALIGCGSLSRCFNLSFRSQTGLHMALEI